MADITMCQDTACELRRKCFRFTAKPNPQGQSYGNFAIDEYGKCKHYWPLLKAKEKQ